MSIELRCPARLSGVLNDDGHLEISCRSSFCKHGGVAIHVFDVVTGELLETKMYKEPVKGEKEQADGLGQLAAVRYP